MSLVKDCVFFFAFVIAMACDYNSPAACVWGIVSLVVTGIITAMYVRESNEVDDI